jgi:hydrogenase maturation protein HypF
MKTIRLPFKVKSAILACGADLKGAFALAKGPDAYLFDGFGDLSDLDNFTRYEKAVGRAKKELNIRPQVIVCDLHPGYFSSRFARDHAVHVFQAQHHEAHVASVMADNNIRGDVLAVAFDGTGYGLDGNIWGGEFFTGNAESFKRIAHLEYIPMPGGEMCIKEPWRMAAGHLYSVFGGGFIKLKIDFVKTVDRKKWAVLKNMIDKKINSPLTSSMGRLFDAVGSMIFNKERVNFEAELPIALEEIAAPGIDDSYRSDSSANIIKGIVRDIEKKTDPSIISAKFHNSVTEMILKAARRSKMKRIVLSGGVFQNRYLINRAVKLLNKNNFKVYTHCDVQTNDSGIPIGQVAIANARSWL